MSNEVIVQEILLKDRKSHLVVVKTKDDIFVEIGQHPDKVILNTVEWLKLKDVLNSLGEDTDD
tara:strand:- start:1054 stop:1242 length:189 start_codon:yes stop_codon:yes gene_type:complete